MVQIITSKQRWFKTVTLDVQFRFLIIKNINFKLVFF